MRRPTSTIRNASPRSSCARTAIGASRSATLRTSSSRAKRTNRRVYSSGKETVFIAITEAPGANPLEMTARVKEKVKELNTQLPADMSIFMDADGSIYIREALKEVMRTLIEASIIVVLVIFLFLGSLRVVAIPIVAIPLSLVTVLFLIWMMGFSINLLTLLAMVIAIGLVVDDAIVVVENVHRHIEARQTAVRCRALGRARSGDAGDRDDADARRRVSADRLPRRTHRRALQRVCADARGRGGRLRRDRAGALPDDVRVSAEGSRPPGEDRELAGCALSDAAPALRTLARALSRQSRRGDVVRRRGAAVPCRCSISSRSASSRRKKTAAASLRSATPPDYGSLEYTTYFLDQMVAAWKTVPEVAHSWQVNEPTSVFGGLQLKPWSERERSLEEIRQEIQRKYDGDQRPRDLHVCRRRIARCVGRVAGAVRDFRQRQLSSSSTAWRTRCSRRRGNPACSRS